MLKHEWDYFTTGDGVSVAEGGEGVVVVGCVGCKKRMQTRNEYIHHIADEILPLIYNYEREPGDEDDLESDGPEL